MKRPASNPSSGNQGQHYSSYQQGVYYASEQTKTLADTQKTYYQADEAASNVLNKLTGQRQQLEGAHDNVWEMRVSTEAAKREIQAREFILFVLWFDCKSRALLPIIFTSMLQFKKSICGKRPGYTP